MQSAVPSALLLLTYCELSFILDGIENGEYAIDFDRRRIDAAFIAGTA